MAYINGNEILFSAQVNGLVNIDDALSDISENPVQNKVVKAALDTKADSATETVTKQDYIIPTWENGYGINASGTKIALSGSIYAEIDVAEGESYTVRAMSNYAYRCLALLDSSGNLVGSVYPSTSIASYINETITIPSGVVTMAVSSPLGNLNQSVVKIYKNYTETENNGALVKYDNMEASLKGLYKEIPNFEDVEYTYQKTGYYKNILSSQTDSYFASDTNFYNGLIDVVEGEVYKISAVVGYAVAMYMFFDESGKWLGRYPTTYKSTPKKETKEITIPVGCVQMGVSGSTIPIVKKKNGITLVTNNVLYDKKIVFNGDSICEGNDTDRIPFASQIGENNNCTIVNYAVGGGTIALTSDSTRHCICDTVSTMANDADFVVFEGGINDYWNDVPLGAITNGMASTIDNTTFYGALESIFRQALVRFVGKKIMFVTTHKINYTWRTANTNGNTFADYHNAIINVCKKYSIPVCDLYETSGFNTEISEYLAYTNDDDNNGTNDGIHPTTEGYSLFYVPQITAMLKTL